MLLETIQITNYIHTVFKEQMTDKEVDKFEAG